MLEVIWLIPAFPLAGFLLILLFGRKLGEPRSGYLASAMVLGVLLAAPVLLPTLATSGRVVRSRETEAPTGHIPRREADRVPKAQAERADAQRVELMVPGPQNPARQPGLQSDEGGLTRRGFRLLDRRCLVRVRADELLHRLHQDRADARSHEPVVLPGARPPAGRRRREVVAADRSGRQRRPDRRRDPRGRAGRWPGACWESGWPMRRSRRWAVSTSW